MNKKYGTFPEPGTIRFERLLPGPIERVWDYMTKSELKARWLSAGDVEPRTGGKVELRFRLKDLSDADDLVPEKYKYMQEDTNFTGRVTTWNPPRLLSYTWGEESGEDSEVTFELTPRGDKVQLVLTHRRLGADPVKLNSVASGWHTHLDILSERLNGKEPPGFWKVHNKMEREYKELISSINPQNA